MVEGGVQTMLSGAGVAAAVAAHGDGREDEEL